MTAPRSAPWAALALVGLALVVGRLNLRTSPDGLDGLLTNADFVSPAALYQDMVIDGYRLADFQFSAATFAVPDVAVYFAARAVAGDHAVALVAWVAALFLLLTAAGVWAACELLPDHRRVAVAVALGGAAAYLGGNAAAGFVHPHNDLLLPVWHNGALTLALAGLAAGLRLVRATRPQAIAGWGAAVAGLTGVGLFSDRFLGFYLILPAAALFLADWWGGRVPGRRLLLWLVATGGGGLAGLVTLRLTLGAADPISNYWKTPDLSLLADRTHRLAQVVGGELRPGNPLMLGAAAWYAWAGVAVAGRLVRPAVPSAVGRVRLFSTVLLLAVTAVFLLSGTADDCLATLDWAVFSRYFVGPIGAAWLGWVVWLAGGRRRWALAPAAGVLAVGGAAVAPPVVDRPQTEWYPAMVRAVDEACRSRGLSAGLGAYGDAKPVSLLSRAGVTVRPVRPDASAPAGLVAFPWLGNSGWYARSPAGGPTAFQFVVVGDRPGRRGALPEAAVVAKLGEPAERVPAGERVLLVYDRPGDWPVRRFGACALDALNRRHERSGEPVAYPGAALLVPPGAAVTDTPDLCRHAEEGRTASGVVAYGPHLTAGRPGWHQATYRLAAAGAAVPVGYADVIWTRPETGESEQLAVSEVAPGLDGELPLKVLLEPRHSGGRLEFRVSYTGRGRLTVREVRFERLRRPGR